MKAMEDNEGTRIGFSTLFHGNVLEIDASGEGGMVWLKAKHARELAAILTHFADTGELPGEVGDDK